MSKIYTKDFDINLSRIKKKPNIANNNNLYINSENNINNNNNNKLISQVQKNLQKKTFYNKINNNSLLKKISLKGIKNTNNDDSSNHITLSELYNMPNSKTRSINFFSKSRNIITLFNKRNNNNNDNFRFITNNNSRNDSEIKKINLKIINCKNSKHSLKIDKINKKVKIVDQFANLPNFMKDRFYSDIEEKLSHQFRNKPFFYDTSLKDKIIQLNQIKEFWGGMSDYTNPILCTKRVRYLSKLIEDRKNLREYNSINDNNVKLVKLVNKRYNKIKMPKLYTNSHITEKNREKIRKMILSGKEKKNKSVNNMHYLI